MKEGSRQAARSSKIGHALFLCPPARREQLHSMTAKKMTQGKKDTLTRSVGMAIMVTTSLSFLGGHHDRHSKEMFAGPNVFEMHEVIQMAEKK